MKNNFIKVIRRVFQCGAKFLKLPNTTGRRRPHYSKPELS